MSYKNCKKNLVLLVDDMPKNLQVLSGALKNEALEIAAALNGKQALEIVKKVKPDLILLDIMMPEMDGFQTIRELKANPETSDIPVLFLTARTEMDDVVKGLEMGAVDYITKPFNHVELLTRVRNHLELKNSRDKFKDLNASKDKLFSIISHDLRTPFAVIIGFAEYLIEHLKSMSPDQIDEMVRDILSTSRQSHQLFENLLQWARSQSGRIQFKPEQIEFNSLVMDVIGLIKARAKEKGILIKTNVPEKCMVTADANMLNTIMRNLTNNAVKFTNAGGTVELSAVPEQDHCLITVADTGVGIPEAVQKKLFKIDEHITTTGTDHEAGSGLGLIVVREFIEKHDGSFWVESTPGKGSRFHMRLPIQQLSERRPDHARLGAKYFNN